MCSFFIEAPMKGELMACKHCCCDDKDTNAHKHHHDCCSSHTNERKASLTNADEPHTIESHADSVDAQDEDDDEDPATLKKQIIISAVLLAAALVSTHLINLPLIVQLIIYLPSYLVAGSGVLKEAAESITHGKPFNEDFLMSIATLGALLIGFIPGGEPQFAEAVFVMLFFQVGELFEGLAEDNSKKSIASLMNIRPDTATVERNGTQLTVNPQEVHPGEVIVIKPGEKVALDGTIIEGTSSLNTLALTGESVPRDVSAGSEVFSGCINESGVLRVRVTKEFAESTATKILDLVQNAQGSKSHQENFIKRFAKVYTPLVVYAALALALIPPLVSGNFTQTFATWLLRALTFLVVSCPCALVLSVPLTFFGGIGAASKKGVLVKGSNYLDVLAQTTTLVFDKTGTLTKGSFKVVAVHPSTLNERELLHLASHVEGHSSHPIAQALVNAYQPACTDCTVKDIQELAGKGICAMVNGHKVAVGNTRLMDAVNASWTQDPDDIGTVVHVALDGTYAGHIVIADEIKDSAQEGLAALQKAGVTRMVMLTGDSNAVAQNVAAKLGLSEVHAELLPAQKVEEVEKLLKQQATGTKLAFVGDGINDAPVLARADVGIAMGAMGSDAAIEAADVVLMDDKLSKIAFAKQVAKHTVGIARQNIVFAITIKLAILVLAAVGAAPMWLAVFGDVGVMVLCVLNATRVLNVK